MLILGIETSCDETAAAVVDGEGAIRSNIVLSQTAEHLPYGGVVPEIAARAHIDYLGDVVKKAMDQAGASYADLDAVAVTGGPGLIGGVIVGVMMAKAIASVHAKPFIAVNHLEGHALVPRLTDKVAFPYLLLLVSGGHCQIMVVEGVGKYVHLGATIDDALGEAFDKTAKLMGLPYPGGPQVEKLARAGNPLRFALPRPLSDREGMDFSFSGLKTAVRNALLQLGENIALADKADMCASFQYTAGVILKDRMEKAAARAKAEYPMVRSLVVSGGVAANRYLRSVLTNVSKNNGLEFVAPPVGLCTDNAAMIAWAGIEKLRLGQKDGLDFEPRARWPLTEAR